MRPHASTSGVWFALDTRRAWWTVLVFCVGAEVLLVILDAVVNVGQAIDVGAVRRLFNTAREDGLASWFGITQTFVVAVLAWLVYAVARTRGWRRGRRTGWLLLALLFTWMAIDDGAEVHERLGTTLEVLTTRSPAAGGSALGAVVDAFPSYAWQILFVPLFAAAGLAAFGFLWREMPRPADRVRVIAALGCFAAAVVLDYFEGIDGAYLGIANALEMPLPIVVHYSRSLEETIEMLGMTLFLVTFLGHLARHTGTLAVRFDDVPV